MKKGAENRKSNWMLTICRTAFDNLRNLTAEAVPFLTAGEAARWDIGR